MSDVKKCDRCGRVYDKGIAGLRAIEVNNQRVDLCPLCGNQLDRWLKEPPPQAAPSS